MAELSAEDRLAELESRYAFLQESHDQLSEMVSNQWNEIERLKKQVKTLDDQLYELEQDQGPVPVQKPPHY